MAEMIVTSKALNLLPPPLLSSLTVVESSCCAVRKHHRPQREAHVTVEE